jgi:hypothetical protein
MSVLMVMTGNPGQAGVTYLGAEASTKTWVYLCGLTDDMHSEHELENRQVLDHLGKKLHIRFLAIHPFERCELAGNLLCWRHYTIGETLATYDKILNAIGDTKIIGFLGFSNGGFFLNQLAQMRELNCPIISVGAVGSFFSPSVRNNLTLIIGKTEPAHDAVHQFVHYSKGSPLKVRLIVHDGGHILPIHELEPLLKELS